MNRRHVVPAAIAVAAAALMAFAVSASATTVTSSAGTTPTIAASAEGHVVFDNAMGKIECGSMFGGKVESHGSGVTAKSNLSSLSFTNCTDSWHVTVVTAGTVEFHSNGTGSGNGYLTSSKMTLEATRLGITCRYATSATTIGDVTAGTHGTLHIYGFLPFHSGSFLCGMGPAHWTGSYKVTSPTNLSIDS